MRVQRLPWEPTRPFTEWLIEHHRHKPVLLSETMAASLRATKLWSPSFLTDRMEQGSLLRDVRVSRTSIFQYVNPELLNKSRELHRDAPPPFDEAPQPVTLANMSMAEFWNRTTAHSAATDHVMYSVELTPGRAPRELLRLAETDLRGVKMWTRPASGAPVRDAKLEAVGGSRGAVAQLWMGGNGATSQAHYDQQHNIYIQLYGRKRFLLSPPSAAAHR